MFNAEEWRPGAIAVYERFADYVPRDEPPSWASGGKVAKVDRVEWVWIPDHQTAVNALLNGEVDFLEAPPHDLYPILEAEPDIVMEQTNTLGNQYMFRFNALHPPFDDPKIRKAALMALKQEDFLNAVIGNPEYYKTCAAMFICGTTFATETGGEIMIEADVEGAKSLLAEAGYDGTPVTLMHSTDLQVLTNLAPVAKAQLERAGFVVDMQSMDWQTLVARRSKKEPPSEGGWNAFMTSWVAADILNPISTAGLNATGETGWFGWFDLPELEAKKKAFAESTDADEQKRLAEEIQLMAIELGTHGWMGQWYQASAWRSNVSGVIPGPAPYFFNVEKEG
jgi:peptide/nickel transport system substrate-binding protein